MLALRHMLNVGLVVALTCAPWNSNVVRADGPTDLASTGLSIAPQDVAFFVTAIDMGEAWETFVQGNFVKSLRRVEYVRSLEQEIRTQWERPSGQMMQVKSTLQNPNVRDLLKLAADMASQEFFVYGEVEWCETIENLVAFQNEIMNRIQDDPASVQAYFNELQRETIDGIRIPTTIFGFRLTNPALARQQLDALEGIIRVVGGQQEELGPLLEKLQRKDWSDGQSLTITLDTSLIPVEAVEEEQRAQVDKVLELLDGRSVSLSLGVKENLLLIALSEDPDVLANVGQAGATLLDHERLSVLKEANVSDLRSIVFASSRWRQSNWDANFKHYFRNLVVQFAVAIDSEVDEDYEDDDQGEEALEEEADDEEGDDEGLEEIADAEQWKEELFQDADRLDELLSSAAAGFGDVLGWSHAIQSGSEGWTYDWSSDPMFENASPLQILEHAGSNSLYLLAFKQRSVPAFTELCEYAMERIPQHAERFIALAEQDEEERELALKVFHQAWPLVEAAADIFQSKISPSLDEKETLFSLSAAWSTRELGDNLPPAEEPLTLPELGLACKLRDRELFLDGCRDLYGVFDQVVELVRETAEDAIPEDYEIPRPIEEAIGDASSYHYEELSSSIGLEGFKPQLVVGEDVVILGYSDRQVRDMLNRQALTTRPAWLTDETPVAVVSYADYGSMLAAVRPWLVYGMYIGGMSLDQPLAPVEGPIPTGNDVLQIWDTFTAAGIAAATATIDDVGPTVVHWVWVSR